MQLHQFNNLLLSKISAKKPFFLGCLIILIVIFFDLFTKNQIYFLLNDNLKNNFDSRKITLTSFFSLIYVNNNGISFGMFSNLKNAKEIFVLVQGGIAFALLFWLWNMKKNYMIIALSLVIGGAFGNAIDRLQNGGVTDFLDFHIASYHWPAFNLADSAIFIGVTIILLDEFIFKKNEKLYG